MRNTRFIFKAGLLLALAGSLTSLAGKPRPALIPMKTGPVKLQSAGVMTFSPQGVLFIGDSQAGAVYAIDLDDSGKAAAAVSIRNLDKQIAARLGIAPEEVVIADMGVHPVTGNVFLSVSRGRGNGARAVLLKVNEKSELEEVSLDKVNYYQTTLASLPSFESKSQWGQPLRPMAITDLAFVDGELLVSGLTTEEFSSRLRRIPYPFRNDMTVASLEIYHTSHDRYETQSPIETFLPYRINGESLLLAGYGCAPLVKFPMNALQSGTHVKGATLAELGGGNRPLDMVGYRKNGKDFIMIANSHRTLMKVSADDIAKASPMTTPVGAAYVSAGVPYVAIAVVGVTQLDNLNDNYFVAVQRSVEDGSLNLVSLDKKWM